MRAPLRVASWASLLLAGCTFLVDSQIEKNGKDVGGGVAPGEDAQVAVEAGAPDASVSGSSDAAVATPGADGATSAASDAATTSAPDANAVEEGGAAVPSSAALLEVSLGDNFGCGLRVNGTISCWGASTEEQRSLPFDRSYRDIGCGAYHCCGLDSAGALLCVGRNRDGQRASAPGPFVQVTAGDAHTCVLDASGKARCWGANGNGQSTPPPDSFRTLSAGGGFTCGVRAEDGRVLCWGLTGEQLTAAASEHRFSSIDAAPSYLCGITDAQLVMCWSEAEYRVSNLGAAQQVSAGAYSGCALLADESVRCWYMGQQVSPFPDKGPFSYVAVGGSGRCAVPKSGPIVCEPSESSLIGSPPADFP